MRGKLLAAMFPIAWLSGSYAVRAEQCDSFKGVVQISAGLASADPVVRMMAESCGLASADRAARELVIRRFLSGGSNFNMSITNVEGDKEGAAYLSLLPTFAYTAVKWSPDGRQFASGGEMSGTLIGDTMTVAFKVVRIDDKKFNGGATECDATLKLNEKRDALEGPLRCKGVPFLFHASIGF
jgi:hypothetical protein